MSKEILKKAKHKISKFKEFNDESLCWEEKVEMQKIRRKRKSQKRKRDNYDEY